MLHALLTLAQPPRFEPCAPTHADLAYAEGRRRGIAPLCDVYLPTSGGTGASVIVVHGGGFVIGHRRMKPVLLLATRLVEAGYAVCAIDYRLCFRGGGLPDQVTDVEAAAAFWRRECARFGCDPERISLLGFSAGATLSLLHASETEHAYHRLISIYGVTDFERVAGRRAELLLRVAIGTGDRRAWRQYSPVARPHPPTPLLLIHGTEDRLVPVSHAHRLHRERSQAGHPTELVLVPGMRHGWLNDASLNESEEAVVRVLDFLA
jgi:acetyl esterase/lipase